MSLRINNSFHELKSVPLDQLNSWKEECADTFPLDKKYQVIYCDPPWDYGTASASLYNQCSEKYPVMSFKELQDLQIKQIADKNCALFLWTTNPKLPEAIELMKHWGFAYKTIFKVWRKVYSNGNPVCTPGWWSRSSTELLLVGSKGSPLKEKTTVSEPQEFTSEREQHSEKPDEIRDAIFSFLDVKNRIELFGRKIVDGWDTWGLETPGYFYEGSGESSVIYNTTEYTQRSVEMRSIGCQVDTLLNLKGKVKKKAVHKPDCQCCVCKGKRSKTN